MAFSRRFELGLAWRALVLLGAFALFLAALQTPGLAAARIVAFLIAFSALASLWQHIRRTNFEVARFIESVRFDDYSQRFSSPSGGGFDVLGHALDEAMRALRDQRGGLAEEVRFLFAVVDDTPQPLLSLSDQGAVTLLNKAARRQFSAHSLTHLEDFEFYGAEFSAAIRQPAGSQRLTRLVTDGVAQRVMLATARVERLGEGLTIASVMPVQTELGAVELATQTDLVRVLTHEIMNSLTPVTSLAHSSAEIVAKAAESDPRLSDAKLAVETLASRADGILRFVDSYRQFARKPEVRRRRFAARAWVDEIGRLSAADPKCGGADLETAIAPADAIIEGDPDLLAQVALNLVRNAALATEGQTERHVRLSVSALQYGRTLIEVADNGPGIAPDRREDVFLPFFTTRADGSGVGLSFARQIVLAHGGTISVEANGVRGALIRLLI